MVAVLSSRRSGFETRRGDQFKEVDMSIPMRFQLYDADGKYLKTSGFMTRSYGSKSGDLTAMQKRFVEDAPDIRLFEKLPALKYIVCTEAIDYMFDVDGFAVLPNKFKNASMV